MSSDFQLIENTLSLSYDTHTSAEKLDHKTITITNLFDKMDPPPKGWETSINEFQPPAYNMHTFSKVENNIIRVRTAVLVPYSFQDILKEVHNPVNIFLTNPHVLEVTSRDSTRMHFKCAVNGYDDSVFYFNCKTRLEMYTDDDFKPHNELFSSNKTQKSSSENYEGVESFETQKKMSRSSKTVFLFYDFKPDYWEYYCLVCQRERDGCSITLELATKAPCVTKWYVELFHSCRIIVHYFLISLSKNTNNYVAATLKKKFEEIIRFVPPDYRLCQRNRFSETYVTRDFSNIIIRNYTLNSIQIDMEKVIEALFLWSSDNVLFDKVQKIGTFNGLNSLHAESSLLAANTTVLDIVTASCVFEGNIFVCGHSLKKLPNCPHRHDGIEQTECLLAGFETRKVNEMIKTRCVLQFYIPSFRKLGFGGIKKRITIFMARLTFLIKAVEYSVVPQIIHSERNMFLTSLQILKASMCMKDKFNKMANEFKKIEEQKNFKLNLDILNNNVLMKILQYLRLKHIVSLKLTCRKFYQQIATCQSTLKAIYTKYYDPKTFGKLYEECSKSQCTSPSDPVDYYTTVLRHEQQNLHWRYTYTTLHKKRHRVYDTPITHIFPTPDNQYVIVSEDGKASLQDYATNNKRVEWVFMKKVVASSFIGGCLSGQKSTEKMFYQFTGGTSSVIQWDNLKEVETYKTVNVDGAAFVGNSKFVGWKGKRIVIYDISVLKEIESYSKTDSIVETIHDYKEDQFLVVSSDKSVAGFDSRSKRSTFLFKGGVPYGGVDWFDWNVVIGNIEGIVEMWDVRYPRMCVNNTVVGGMTNALRCYNRKVVVGTQNKLVEMAFCDKGRMEQFNCLYQHEHPVTSVYFKDDVLVTGSNDGVVYSTTF
ncbi:hypothetical protein EIN_274200 [Entamoeba invadens IP1]|uniref:F-box domain-containing protein n=1 Tax=Entamoeba invadens IP1 TaxID=370355 RepID=A0A0A1U4P0_ENTIV|nr:hypothetical protein EIN_274200 [Entamoeba invadens IP1]ELP87853.1 hypothetical protein EIN_274200 [Entamoeba invadens IP1]|eukprot:XP_004254624.1 hypothetical protein EIN_274200 [Entamoeba invadens IP1]